MTEYEKAMLKLKLLELTQRQTVLALLAHSTCDHEHGVDLAEESRRTLDKAVDYIETLI